MFYPLLVILATFRCKLSIDIWLALVQILKRQQTHMSNVGVFIFSWG